MKIFIATILLVMSMGVASEVVYGERSVSARDYEIVRSALVVAQDTIETLEANLRHSEAISRALANQVANAESEIQLLESSLASTQATLETCQADNTGTVDEDALASITDKINDIWIWTTQEKDDYEASIVDLIGQLNACVLNSA